jgi:hypothetical protein
MGVVDDMSENAKKTADEYNEEQKIKLEQQKAEDTTEES